MSPALSSASAIAKRAVQQWRCITSEPVLVMQRENAVFRVETKFGPAALRVHRHGYHGKIAIQSEMLWMAHLSKMGLEIPQPLANRRGDYLCEIEQEGKVHFADLLTWLDGIPLGNSVDPLAFDRAGLQKIFFNLGAVMARLHTVSDGWKMPSGFQRPAWDRTGFVGNTPLWGAFWEARDISEVERRTLVAARAKAGLVLDAMRNQGTDYGLIHADFVRQNILVDGTDVRLIDFDDSGFGFRLYDLATALVKNRAEPHYDAITEALFAGYRSQRKLSLQDEKLLPVFLALRDLAYLGWMEARRNEPGIEHRMPAIHTAALAAAEEFLGMALPVR